MGGMLAMGVEALGGIFGGASAGGGILEGLGSMVGGLGGLGSLLGDGLGGLLGGMGGIGGALGGSGGLGGVLGPLGNLGMLGSSVMGLFGDTSNQKKLSKYQMQYAKQLHDLMANPGSITSMPGYEAGLEAVQRSMAAQGYTGSGNMMAALQKYGGDFFNNQVTQLQQLAGGASAQSTAADASMSDNLGGLFAALGGLAGKGGGALPALPHVGLGGVVGAPQINVPGVSSTSGLPSF